MAELYEERSKGSLFWNAFNSLEEVLYAYDPITGRWRYESDEGKVRECLEDFGGIITSILTGGQSITKAIMDDLPVEKAGKKMSAKNRETLASIHESLGAFLKEFDDPEPEGTEEPDDTKTKKEDKEVTKQEVQQIVDAAITKALGAAQEQAAPETTPATAITPEAIEKMVASAIEKAMQPKQETFTMEQLPDMIEAAVAKAVEPVLKSRGLPSNLGSEPVEKQQEQHYLHGII